MKLMCDGEDVAIVPVRGQLGAPRVDAIQLDYKDMCDLQSATPEQLQHWLEIVSMRFVPGEAEMKICELCGQDITPDWKVEALRETGHAIAVFTPEELGRVDQKRFEVWLAANGQRYLDEQNNQGQ